MMEGDLRELAQEILSGVGEGSNVPAPRESSMGGLQKIRYTHDAMIDAIIAQPAVAQNTLAAMFGFSASWVSNIIASDAFQARLAERRAELIDPTLVATIEERAKALFIRAQQVLMEKLEKPLVSDNVALRAYELGAKSVGVGGNAAPKIVPVDLTALADRLLALKRGQPEAIEGESSRVVS